MALDFESVAELGPEDLGGLSSAAPNRVERLRDSHHALARVMASGLEMVEASAVTGYSITRIHRLLESPAFAELVEFYRLRGDAAVANLTDRMSTLGASALAELQERLDEAPEGFTVMGLRHLVEMTADRTGYGPKSTQVNINLDLEQRLDAARQRAGLVADPKELPSPKELTPAQEFGRTIEGSLSRIHAVSEPLAGVREPPASTTKGAGSPEELESRKDSKP